MSRKETEPDNAPDIVVEVDGEPVETETTQPDAVIVVKNKDEQGNISTEIIYQGNIEPTEVQTLLELGINGWRQRIGLTR